MLCAWHSAAAHGAVARHRSTCSPPPVLTVRPRSRSRWRAPRAAHTCRRGLCCTCGTACHFAVRRRSLAYQDPVPAGVPGNTATRTIARMAAACIMFALLACSMHAWETLTARGHHHPTLPPATPRQKAGSATIKEGGLPQNGICHDTQCPNRPWYDRLDGSLRRALESMAPYHAAFLVVLAKLQGQIAERLRARLHRHGLVVGEAVLL